MELEILRRLGNTHNIMIMVGNAHPTFQPYREL